VSAMDRQKATAIFSRRSFVAGAATPGGFNF